MQCFPPPPPHPTHPIPTPTTPPSPLAGWHSLVAVGSAGSGQCRGGATTAFFLNGRACGAVRAQARAAIGRLGGGLGLCLADVRLYGAALPPAAGMPHRARTPE